ncbi:MAG TPA: AraC family transcriptional regulator [Planctomycetota bacterium]
MLKELLPTLRLKVMNVGFKKDGVNWNYKGVNSPFSRLYLITRGLAYTRHHGQTFALTPGKLHLVPSFTLSDYACPKAFEYYYIQFTSRLEGDVDLFNLGEFDYSLDAPRGFEGKFKRIYELIPGKEVTVCRPFDDEQKKGFLKSLDHKDFDGSVGAWIESDGLLRQVLAPVVESFRSPAEGEGRNPFLQVLKHIEEHLDKNLSLADMAAVMHLQPTYFSDRFHEVVGVRPMEFLRRRKIEKAQILMLAQGMDIKEAAFALGFSDAAYFSRLFRKYTGMTPTDYIRRETMRLDSTELCELERAAKGR